MELLLYASAHTGSAPCDGLEFQALIIGQGLVWYGVLYRSSHSLHVPAALCRLGGMWWLCTTSLLEVGFAMAPFSSTCKSGSAQGLSGWNCLMRERALQYVMQIEME